MVDNTVVCILGICGVLVHINKAETARNRLSAKLQCVLIEAIDIQMLRLHAYFAADSVLFSG